MKSGIKDYDDEAIKLWTYNHPDEDILPIDFLYMHKPDDWWCNPGHCEAYSSIGYVLLGYVLAQNAGAKDWADFDYMTIIPEKIRNKYNNTVFTGTGHCSQYNTIGMVATYSMDVSGKWPGLVEE